MVIIKTTLTILAVFASVLLASPLRDQQLTSAEKRGQYIYERGITSSNNKVTAVIADGTEVPASVLTCAGCHGPDGRGKPEGGVAPSDLSWQSLTTPYTITTPTGRKRPPYTESLLKRAITMGIDPAGNKLHTAMPRFRLSLEDMEDLIAYIKILGIRREPGVADSHIKIGTILPTEGPASTSVGPVIDLIKAHFDEVNRTGGIFGRKLELSAITQDDVRRDDAPDVFALVSPFISGYEKELALAFEDRQLPVIGPITLLPQAGFPLKRHTFYLYSGLSEQVRALSAFASRNLKSSYTRVGVVSLDAELTSGLAKIVDQECNRYGAKLVALQKYPEGQFDAAKFIAEFKTVNADTIFLFGLPGDELRLINEAAKYDWRPNFLILGSLVGTEIFDIPPDSKDRVFVSYPTLPLDRSPEGIKRFFALAENHKLSRNHLTMQLSAYSSTLILVQGLRLAGRDLTREKLVNVLEGLYRFNTGLTPPITFGPNRRIGALGAYVVTVEPDKKNMIPRGGWITLE